MSKWKSELFERGLSFGMDVVQKVVAHPTVGSLVIRSISQGFELKGTLEQAHEQLLIKMQIASSQEQEEIRSHVTNLEKKIERLERRLRELNTQARKAEIEAAKEAAKDSSALS